MMTRPLSLDKMTRRINPGEREEVVCGKSCSAGAGTSVAETSSLYVKYDER